MSKQDRQGARSPADLERKYEFDFISKLETDSKKQSEQIDRQNRTMDEFIANSSDTIASMEKDISRAKKDISSLKVGLTSLSIRIGDTEGLNEVESIKKDFTTLNESIHKSEEEITRLKQKQDELSANINNRKFAVNLLDNSDFSNLIAQAGLLGVHGTEAYLADRWIAFGTLAMVYNNDHYSLTYTGNSRATIRQNVPGNYAGKTLTFALKCKCADKIYLEFCDHGGNRINNKSFSNVDGIICYALTIPDDVTSVGVKLYPSYNDGTIPTNIYWAALYEGEYTIDTLPEYQPKGYGAELAECQRYFLKGSESSMWFPIHVNESSYINFSISLPVTMRTTPTVVTSASKPQIFIDGTYYNLGTEGFNNIFTTAGHVTFYGSVSRFSNVPVNTGTSYIGRYSPDLSADL